MIWNESSNDVKWKQDPKSTAISLTAASTEATKQQALKAIHALPVNIHHYPAVIKAKQKDCTKKNPTLSKY